ncbi:MAG: wax ester/triacylglycerol synthase family O-acyltransferase [Acidimicrobiales bacterium]
MTTEDHAADGGYPSHMGPAEAVLWDIESDPVLRSTITALAILDRAPNWDRMVHRLDIATRTIPRLRQRVVEPPLRLGSPRWVTDPEFDLEYHLRRAEVPAPGTLRDVLDLVQPLAIAPFDRSRPLWEFTLIEGLEDGRAAFVQKVHHTVTDGVGGIELALSILDERRVVRNPELPPLPEAGSVDSLSATTDALAGTARSLLRTGVNLPIAGARAAADTAMHPIRNVGRAIGLTRSVGKMVAPVPRSASPIMTERSLRRRFDTIDVTLSQLKKAAKVADGTANDALLAAVVEGIRRYHVRHEAELDELRITMPINLRHAGGEHGNHFAPARFAVPANIDDPVDRMRVVGSIARRWRAEPALDSSDAIALVLDRLPTPVTTAVFGAMLKHVDVVVTNVPGIPSRSYLAGAELLREYAFAPPTGAALNVALVSHVHTACIGIVSDGAAIPDHDVLVECLVEGFDEVLGLVGAHARRSS